MGPTKPKTKSVLCVNVCCVLCHECFALNGPPVYYAALCQLFEDSKLLSQTLLCVLRILGLVVKILGLVVKILGLVVPSFQACCMESRGDWWTICSPAGLFVVVVVAKLLS